MNIKLRSTRAKYLVAICLAYGPVRAETTTLCEPGESTLFSCEFQNKRSASICASSVPGPDYVEYRFGRRPNVEMRYRADENHANKRFHRAEVVYASNSERVIWFRDRDIFYRIHLPMRGGPSLEVSREGKTLNELFCKGGWGRVHAEPESKSKFIIEHGSGDISKMSPLWGDE